MKKPLIAFICTFVLLAQLFTGCDVNVNIDKETAASQFEYEDVSGGIMITKYLGNDKKVVVPSIVDNKKVVDIDETAFSGNIVLEEIVFPEHSKGSLLYFTHLKGCDSLKKVVFNGSFYNDKYVYITLPDFAQLEEIHINKMDATLIADTYRKFGIWRSLKKIVINEVLNSGNISGNVDLSNLSTSTETPVPTSNAQVVVPQDFVVTILQGKLLHITHSKDNLSKLYLNSGIDSYGETQPSECFKAAIQSLSKKQPFPFSANFQACEGKLEWAQLTSTWIEETITQDNSQKKILMPLDDIVSWDLSYEWDPSEYTPDEIFSNATTKMEKILSTEYDFSSYYIVDESISNPAMAMCIAFGCSNITVNGTQYSYNFE